jgi:adenylosuccinate synthase
LSDDIAALRQGRSLADLLLDDEIGCTHQCLCGEAADELKRLLHRVDDLLDANNRFEERARQAERRAKLLEERIRQLIEHIPFLVP